jgi:predicted kinase
MENSMIIIVFGLPGSGKTYFAAELAGRMRATYLNTDVVRQQIIDDSDYSPEEKATVYGRMLLLTEEAIRKGEDVVLDGTFFTAALREPFRQLEGEGQDVFFLEIRADEDCIAHRLARPRQNSAADLTVYKAIAAQWEPLEDEHLVLWSTDNNLAELLRKAFDYLHLLYEV